MNSRFVNKATVTLAIMAFAPSVNAVGCFSGGQTGRCSAASISTFCNSLNGVVFPANTQVTRCFDMTGFRCDMKIVNTGGGGSTIGVQECIDDQTLTNNGCGSHGGIRADGNFQLTLDPNTGAC